MRNGPVRYDSMGRWDTKRPGTNVFYSVRTPRTDEESVLAATGYSRPATVNDIVLESKLEPETVDFLLKHLIRMRRVEETGGKPRSFIATRLGRRHMLETHAMDSIEKSRSNLVPK